MSIVILVLAVTLKDESVLVKLLLVELMVMLVRLMVLVVRGSSGISLHIGDECESALVDKYFDGIDDGIMHVITNV